MKNKRTVELMKAGVAVLGHFCTALLPKSIADAAKRP